MVVIVFTVYSNYEKIENYPFSGRKFNQLPKTPTDDFRWNELPYR